MCDGYGIDIWRELKAIRELLEGFQQRSEDYNKESAMTVELTAERDSGSNEEDPKPKKKAGRRKGSKNANTKTKKK